MEVSIFRQKQRFKIRMAGKDNAEKVVCFPFVPVGTLVDMGYCRYFRVAAVKPGADYDPAKLIEMIEIIDYFQLLLINPVNTGNGLYKEILPVKYLGRGHYFFWWQVYIKVKALGLVIRFSRTRWGRWLCHCFLLAGFAFLCLRVRSSLSSCHFSLRPFFWRCLNIFIQAV